MWRSIGCFLAATIGIALAAPEPPRRAWADWSGSYRGSLTWSGCSVAGAKTAAIELDFTDGVATIDLAPARAGMPRLSLVSDDKGWSARQGDVAVAIALPKANTIDLAVDLDSGCLVRGRLVRASTGVAACDALVGWARVEARCTKLSSPPLEDVAKLMTAKWKPADANRCASRAATLERALVDAGCAPHQDPQIGVRARDCLDLAQLASKLSRCGSALPDVRDAAVATANALVAAAQTAEKATLPYVEQQCRDTRAAIVSIATNFRCPL